MLRRIPAALAAIAVSFLIAAALVDDAGAGPETPTPPPADRTAIAVPADPAGTR